MAQNELDQGFNCYKEYMIVSRFKNLQGIRRTYPERTNSNSENMFF